jgi:hypothetical protein
MSAFEWIKNDLRILLFDYCNIIGLFKAEPFCDHILTLILCRQWRITCQCMKVN